MVRGKREREGIIYVLAPWPVQGSEEEEEEEEEGDTEKRYSREEKRENTNCSKLQTLPSLINCTFCLINVTHEYKICKALSKFTLFKELN